MFIQNFHSLDFLRNLLKSRKYLTRKDKIRTVYFAKKNYSITKISNLLDISKSSVKLWIRQYNSASLKGLFPSKVRKRKIKFPLELAEKLTKRICKGPTKKDNTQAFSLVDVQKILIKEYNTHYCIASVANLLKRLKISYTKPRPVHPKTDKEIQKKWLQKDLPFF